MFKSGIKRVKFANDLPDGWVLDKEIDADGNEVNPYPFNLSIPLEKGFLDMGEDKPKKVLLVLEHIASQDLREKALFSNNATRDIIAKLMYEARRYASNNSESTSGLEDAAYAAINFNFFKTYHLASDRYTSALKHSARRVKRFIAKYKPDWVIVFGDEAAQALLARQNQSVSVGSDKDVDHSDKNIQFKRGWVHELEVKIGVHEHTCKVVNTLAPSDDILKFFSDNDGDEDDHDGAIDAANLAGYIVRTAASLYSGALCYDLSTVKAKPLWIKTIDKFDALMRKVDAAPYVAVDLETTGLDVHGNHILTIQFAFDSSRGYVVALHHKDSLFTAKELKTVKARLRQFFAQKIEYTGKDTRYLIGQGLKFDLRVLRQELKIPHIYWPIYDTLSGEYCFHPETLVETERGRIVIKDLVVMENPPKVLSYNHATGGAEYKDILASSIHPTTEDMFEIDYDGGTLQVTGNHKVWSVTRSTYVMAKDLTIDDEILLLGELPF